MTRRTLTASLSLAMLTALSSVQPVLAECSPQPEHFPPMRFAFTATVIDFAYGDARSTPDRDWYLEMGVERTFRGVLPARLTATGVEVGCDFNGVDVRTGERLFIAAEDVDIGDPRLITGKAFIWRAVAPDRWEFYADALQDGVLGYPAAIVGARSTQEILAALGRLRAPETATATAPMVGSHPPSLQLLAAVFVLALLAGLRRVGSKEATRVTLDPSG